MGDLNEHVSGETPNWPEMRVRDLKREVARHLASEDDMYRKSSESHDQASLTYALLGMSMAGSKRTTDGCEARHAAKGRLRMSHTSMQIILNKRRLRNSRACAHAKTSSYIRRRGRPRVFEGSTSIGSKGRRVDQKGGQNSQDSNGKLFIQR